MRLLRISRNRRAGRAVRAVGQNLRRVRPLITEAAVLTVLLAGYDWGRHIADGRVGQAMGNAARVWAIERMARLPDETVVQRWALGWGHTARLVNLYYLGVHFPLTAAVLAWLFLRHRSVYTWIRTELVLLTAAALVLHVLVPLAPPRLTPGLGALDTMRLVGPSAYPPGDDGIANQYAAMPSLHVGWAVLVAVALIRVTRGRRRWLALLHPLLTTAVVVVTANHYWLDGLVAIALLAAAVPAVRVLDLLFADSFLGAREAPLDHDLDGVVVSAASGTRLIGPTPGAGTLAAGRRQIPFPDPTGRPAQRLPAVDRRSDACLGRA